MSQNRKLNRGIPEVPSTPLSALAGDTRLSTKDVAAHQRKSVGSVQSQRQRRSPFAPQWRYDERGRAYMTVGDLRKFMAVPQAYSRQAQATADQHAEH